jgi:hypothetical protein
MLSMPTSNSVAPFQRRPHRASQSPDEGISPVPLSPSQALIKPAIQRIDLDRGLKKNHRIGR